MIIFTYNYTHTHARRKPHIVQYLVKWVKLYMLQFEYLNQLIGVDVLKLRMLIWYCVATFNCFDDENYLVDG